MESCYNKPINYELRDNLVTKGLIATTWKVSELKLKDGTPFIWVTLKGNKGFYKDLVVKHGKIEVYDIIKIGIISGKELDSIIDQLKLNIDLFNDLDSRPTRCISLYETSIKRLNQVILEYLTGKEVV